MKGIPSVKTWSVAVISGGKTIAKHEVLAPTKRLAQIGFALDFPKYWGDTIKVGLKRKI